MQNLPVNLCTICRSPGACCKDFPLSVSFWDDQDINEQWQAFIEKNAGGNNGALSQFYPVRKMPETRGHDSDGIWHYWRFRCTALLPNGRCGMYAMRPAACQNYAPGTDKLCVMFVPGRVSETSMPKELA